MRQWVNMVVFGILPVAMLIAVAVVPSASAGDCVVRSRSSCYSGYNTYYSPAPYYPPQPTYYHDYIVKTIEVPVYNQGYYYSSDSAFRDTLLADAIAYRILSMQGGGVRQVPLQQQQDPGSAKGADPVPQRQVAAVPAGLSTTVNPKLKAVVDSACIKCHQGPSAKNRFVDLSDLATTPELVRLKAMKAVYKGAMPKGSDPLPDANVGLFDEWCDSAAAATGGK